MSTDGKTPTTAPKTATATAPPAPKAPPAKKSETGPEAVRIKMHTSMGGFHQIPVLDDNGKQQTNPRNNKPLTRNGGEYSRVPDKEYDVDADEAERLVNEGYASYVEVAA